jgi:hypothetical protein
VRASGAAFLRVAGRSRAADGAAIAWSVAEGGRGRRWRAVATLDGTITHTLLLEVAPAGRISRVELVTPAGMLTLHPERGERAIHGNVVGVDGSVRPLAFEWSPDHEIDVSGRPVATWVGLYRRRDTVAVGEVVSIQVLAIDPGLRVTMARRSVTRLDRERWLVASGLADPAIELRLDADGLPAAEVVGPLET